MLVVVGHIIQFNGIQGGINSKVFNIIYSFHMPLFFCISGYIGYKTVKIYDLKSLLNHLLNKSISLLIPLFSWSLLVNKFFSQQLISVTVEDITATILNPGLWFLKTLFEIFFFYGFFTWISTVINKNNKFWIDILVFVLIIFLTVGYNKLFGKSIFSSLTLYTLFFYLAVFISKYPKLENIVNNQWMFALSLIVFVMLIGHWQGGGTIFEDGLKIIISTFAFIAFLNITIRLDWDPFVSRQIMLFGKYSLAIYVIQFYLTRLTISSPISFFDTTNPILLFLICTIIAIPLCFVSVWIAKLIELNSILNFIFLGKRIKYRR